LLSQILAKFKPSTEVIPSFFTPGTGGQPQPLSYTPLTNYMPNTTYPTPGRVIGRSVYPTPDQMPGKDYLKAFGARVAPRVQLD